MSCLCTYEEGELVTNPSCGQHGRIEKMNIIVGYPPNYAQIVKYFPSVKDKPILFAYGNDLYNPSGGEIPGHLLVHEGVHARQQKNIGPKVWWDRYLKRSQFRLSQEVEAYRAQYRNYLEVVRDRNKCSLFLQSLARDLSSEEYGHLVPPSTAFKLIKQ